MRNLKRVLALALALVMVIGMMVMGVSAASYTDAADITADYEEAIAVMSGVGMFQGDEESNFLPTKVLTQAEAAVLMARLMLGKTTADKLIATKQIFSDVPLTAATEWYAAEVEYCYQAGLIAGNGKGQFNPDAQLTGIAFAKLILVAMGYDPAAQGYVGADWASNIAVDALNAGLKVEDVLLSAPVTRELAAQMLFQALDEDVVTYRTSYDYATGAHVVVGPLSDNKYADFAAKYFDDLVCDTTRGYGMWGRPYSYEWTYDGVALYTAWDTPVAVYTEAVTECDIAEDLNLKADAEIKKATLNNAAADEDEFGGDEWIDLLATRTKIGAQGRLTEIYKNGKTYELVMIDTYLAVVTDVTEVEYDRNGHIEEYAELSLLVFTDEDGVEKTLSSSKNYSYEAGEWVLVYMNEKPTKSVPVIQAYAESMVGAQTAIIRNADAHEVEDKEYNDAHTFYLDEAGKETSNHVWFFDLYGNLIGAVDPAAAAATYGVISSIYWKDSRDGENGYAWTKITYMDGESEWVKVAAINDETLHGVEGADDVSYEQGMVSSTKQYNKDFLNVALYEIVEDDGVLYLYDTAELVDAEIETGVPALDDEDDMNAGKSTMFLIWTGKAYETYTGIKNVPSYEEANGWYVDAREDGVADYIFLNETKNTTASTTTYATFYFDGDLRVRESLKNKTYTVTGGYVNGELASVVFKSTDNWMETVTDAENEGVLMYLTLTNGVVTKAEYVTDTAESYKVSGTTYYAVYAGAAELAELEDGVLMADGAAYNVDGLENVITYNKGLSATLKRDPNAYLYVVYTVGKNNAKTAQIVYITDVEGLADVVADQDALNDAIGSGTVVLASGTYVIPNGNIDDLSVVGALGAEVVINEVVDNGVSAGKTLTFENVTFTTTGQQRALANGAINGTVKFVNCTFTGTYGVSCEGLKDGASAVFEGCTFTGLNCAIGGVLDTAKVTIANCTFVNCTEAIGYVGTDAAAYQAALEAAGCTFTNSAVNAYS